MIVLFEIDGVLDEQGFKVPYLVIGDILLSISIQSSNRSHSVVEGKKHTNFMASSIPSSSFKPETM